MVHKNKRVIIAELQNRVYLQVGFERGLCCVPEKIFFFLNKTVASTFMTDLELEKVQSTQTCVNNQIFFTQHPKQS